MKITLVIDHFHPSKGGAERSLEEILSALHAHGHALQLVAMTWDPAVEKWLETHCVSVTRFPRWRRDLSFAENSSALLRKLSPDLVLGVRHTFDIDIFLARNGLYCEALKATLRAKPSPLRKLLQHVLPKHRVLLDLERKLFTRSKPPLVIAPSKLVKEHCQKNFALADERVSVIYNGVDLQKFSPAIPEKRRELRTALRVGEEIVFLFAAHNFRLKGLDCLLEAWSKLSGKPFRLLVMGRDKPPQRARDFGNITFLGARADTVELYQAADVLVHPSFSDTFGRVILEALACGLPVITTRLAGASELITDGKEGYVLDDPQETSALAERMARFEDRNCLQNFSLSARRLAERFPKSAYLEQTVAAIEAEGRRKLL